MSGLLASILIKVGHTVQCPCCPALIDSVRNSEIQIGADIRNIFGTVYIFLIIGQNYLPKVRNSEIKIWAEIRNIFGTVYIFPIMGQNDLPKVFCRCSFFV